MTRAHEELIEASSPETDAEMHSTDEGDVLSEKSHKVSCSLPVIDGAGLDIHVNEHGGKHYNVVVGNKLSTHEDSPARDYDSRLAKKVSLSVNIGLDQSLNRSADNLQEGLACHDHPRKESHYPGRQFPLINGSESGEDCQKIDSGGDSQKSEDSMKRLRNQCHQDKERKNAKDESNVGAKDSQTSVQNTQKYLLQNRLLPMNVILVSGALAYFIFAFNSAGFVASARQHTSPRLPNLGMVVSIKEDSPQGSKLVAILDKR